MPKSGGSLQILQIDRAGFSDDLRIGAGNIRQRRGWDNVRRFVVRVPVEAGPYQLDRRRKLIDSANFPGWRAGRDLEYRHAEGCQGLTVMFSSLWLPPTYQSNVAAKFDLEMVWLPITSSLTAVCSQLMSSAFFANNSLCWESQTPLSAVPSW